jgi:hypothetical protein
MLKLLKSCGVATIRLLIAFGISIVSGALSFAQPNSPMRECKAADLDVTFQFLNDAPSDQVVALNFQNVSEHSCILSGGIGAMFNDVRHGHNIWTKQCLNCSSEGKPMPIDPVALATGEFGHLVLRWKSAPLREGAICQDAGSFNTDSFLIEAPSLIQHVCSVVNVDSYLPGAFIADSPLRDKDGAMQPSIGVKLEASDSTLYAGDNFSFHVTVDDRRRELLLSEGSCPMTFIRTRTVGGAGAFEEISFYAKCAITSGNDGGRIIRMEISHPGLGVLNQIGSSNIQFQVLAGSPVARRVRMIASNKIDLKIVDPATLPRTWGAEVNGVAISLGLDKEAYTLGQDVPLRIALENFSATRDIQSGELPCGAGLKIEVQDQTQSSVVSADPGERMFCLFHGRVMKYPKGQVVPILGITLKELGALPAVPGTYSVTATWTALGARDKESNNNSYPFVPYAVTHSNRVKFRVVTAQGQGQ